MTKGSFVTARVLLPLASGVFCASLFALPLQSTQAPDNTANNKTQTPTADQQGMDPADRDITQKIRKSIHEDKSLSTYGHNIKIITQNGKVTLSGPVKTLDAKNSIHAKAAVIAGEENITDNLQVETPSH